MVRQRLVDQAAFITSQKAEGHDGGYDEVNPELSFSRYLSSLLAHVQSHIDYEHPELEESASEVTDDE